MSNESMRDTGIRWIGTIPSDWDTKRIKYMAKLKGRIGWQGLTSDEYQDEGAFLITGTDFDAGHINWDTCVHVPMSRWEEARDIQIENGDLLITKDGTVGKVALVDNMPGETSLNSGVLRIMPKEGYSRRFLFWVLQSEEFWNWFNYKNAGTSTITHLYQGDFAEFVYAFPEYEEQEEIADYLDAKCTNEDLFIETIEKQVDLLKKIKKAIITKAVTKGLNKDVQMKDSQTDWFGEIPNHWTVKRLKYLLKGIKDGTHGTFDRVENGHLLLSAKNVFEDGIHISENESMISDKDYAQIVANGYPQKGDVLLCCVGTVGRTCVYNFDNPEAFQRSVIFMRPNNLISSRFLCYALQSDGVTAQERILVNKTAQDGLYMGATQEIMIALPTYDEQEAIADYIDRECNRIEIIISTKLEQLSLLNREKKSLIYEYVTGKKRVKEVQ